VEPPGMLPFTLNDAVDKLLKKEFDIYRLKKTPHPIMLEYNIEAVPFSHPMIDEWRETFKGIQYHHRPTNLIIFGAVDDIWIDKKGDLFVVDYKATSTSEPISLDAEYRQAFKRQMEIYQWLLRNLNFQVSSRGYFVFCNADKTKESFDGKLEFEMEVISYQGNADWVEAVIFEAHKCLLSDQLPTYKEECEYCQYRRATEALEKNERKNRPLHIPLQGELFTS
jgi:RecB family exonuclease